METKEVPLMHDFGARSLSSVVMLLDSKAHPP